MSEETVKTPESSNFIEDIIREELAEGGRCHGRAIQTRFPPEPNGYLHIGHAKALCIDFGMAEKFGGECHLRRDDTNPTKEDVEYVDAIQEDIHWLGYDWGKHFYYASDYFEKMYELAVGLIRKGLAYVCQLTPEQMRENRGDLSRPAVSPYRDRPVEESLDLFARMRAGEFPDGSMTLRAKIDLASGNFNMRDPVIYRINHAHHHRQGDKWCVYPMYDFAHPIEDMLEGITHSLCSLEFEDHRPLYNWVVEHVDLEADPRQIEFARLNINYTVMSKHKRLGHDHHGAGLEKIGPQQDGDHFPSVPVSVGQNGQIGIEKLNRQDQRGEGRYDQHGQCPSGLVSAALAQPVSPSYCLYNLSMTGSRSFVNAGPSPYPRIMLTQRFL